MNYKPAIITVTLVIGIGIGLVAARVSVAEPAAPEPEPSAQTENETEAAARSNDEQAMLSVPTYRPPKRGAPDARVGGGTRGPGDTRPYLTVITPPHTALTARSQPVLYWYLSETLSTHFELALISDRDIEPVVELTMGGDLAPGIHSIELSDHNVRLEPGIAYQWSVAAVLDPAHRSSDILSSAMLEYSEATPELEGMLRDAEPEQAVRLYSEAGYWYEAYAGVSRLIADNPGNTRYIAQRNALLKQAGLPIVFEYARQHPDMPAGE